MLNTKTSKIKFGAVRNCRKPSLYLIIIFALFSFCIKAQQANFTWAKAMGGTSSDVGYFIAVDASGNVYTVGSFSGTADFDPGVSVFTLTATGQEVFVSKLDAAGNFIWAKELGGGPYALGTSIAVDPSGNVYTTGYFQGTSDFDPGSSTYTLTAAASDVFVSKLDVNGNFVWAKQFGGATGDIGYSIALDALGNVYTAGYFHVTADFDPSAGVFNLTSAGAEDVFVSKLDALGNFVWAKQMGGASFEYGNSIAVDASGNVYTTGPFYGTVDFDPGTSVFNLTPLGSGSADIFVSKLDASGNFVWAKQMGGFAGDVSNAIALDASANVYTTGFFNGIADFDPGAGTFNIPSAGNNDIFISKLDASGNFVWAKAMGSTSSEEGRSIVLDAAGNVYTAGLFNGITDFDPNAGVFNLTSAGSWDIFVHKMSQGFIGINENIFQDMINIYPNPFNDKITIVTNGTKQTIQIFNVLGSLVYNTITESEKIEIDLSNQPSGIYFIKLGSIVKKIIKE